MVFPTIVVCLFSGDEILRLEEDFSKVKLPANQTVFFANSQSEASAVITSEKKQVMFSEKVEDNYWFELEMKEKNPELVIVQFGFSRLTGPPKPPYDILMTVAHSDKSYVDSIETIMREFKARVR